MNNEKYKQLLALADREQGGQVSYKVKISMPVEAMKRLRDKYMSGKPEDIAALKELGILEIHFSKPDMGVEIVKIEKEKP